MFARMTRSVPIQATVLGALPPAEAVVVEHLGRAFAATGHELVLVGGIVRDALMGRELPNDLDFATDAVPEQTQAIGEAAGASSVYLVGAKFGTVGLVFADDEGAPITAEITTYRSEHYPGETRHPEVAFGDRLEDDLSRRDLTVNAIAADAATGALIDPFDGQSDLARGILRAVGDADTRFQEDPLRLLRAARFVAQLGFFVEPATAAAMARQAPSLGRISNERIYADLTRLLTGDWASHGLETLHETGLIPIAMPELAPLAAEAESRRDRRGPVHREKDLWEHTKKVVDRAPARPIVRWAALLHDAAKPHTRSVDATGDVHFFGHEREGAALAKRLLGRLKADRSTQVAVARLVELHLRPATYEPDWTDSAVRRLMLEADGVLDDLLDLVAADVTSAREQKQRAAARRIELLRAHIRRLEEERALAEFKSPLDGDDLMRLFARPPGRWIATIKDHLRELVLDGELAPDDVATAEQIARGMIERGEA
jgi:poly(A) polymerase